MLCDLSDRDYRLVGVLRSGRLTTVHEVVAALHMLNERRPEGLTLNAIVLALTFQWPAHLVGGSGNPNITAGEFVANGTVTSLPLFPWIALTVFALLARSRRWWGMHNPMDRGMGVGRQSLSSSR